MNRFFDCRQLISPLILPNLLLAILICTAVAFPRAAVAEPLNSDPPEKSSIAALLDELDDIDFARSVTPLKLTSEQIDKLAAAITDIKTQYDKKIADLSDATVGQMADEIHKRHKEVVAGAPVSDAFDTKVKRMMTDFYAKRDTINADNIKAMALACSKILTSDQIKIAVQMEKDTYAKKGTKLDPSNPDSKYLNLYVVDIFIGYRRIVPLLKSMKPAA